MIDSWQILRFVHKLGSPLKATVIGFDGFGRILVETGTGFQSVISTESLAINSKHLPGIGEELDAVVVNCVDSILFLSASPSDTSQQSIEAWQAYYQFIDTLELGSRVKGIVTALQAFGLFVDIGIPYVGLIDIGHDRSSGGDQLPDDMTIWPQVGDEIDCCVSYLRLHNQQIGLGWISPQACEAS